jgi:hypothetical protein
VELLNAPEAQFSNFGKSPVEALQSLEQFMQERVLGVRILSSLDGDTCTNARIRNFGNISITLFSVSPQVMRRDPDQMADGDIGYNLSIVEKGRVAVRRGVERDILHAGQAVIVPTHSPSCFQFTEPSIIWGLRIRNPSGELSEACNALAREHMAFKGPSVELARRYCELVLDGLESGPATVVDTICRHMIGFLAEAAPHPCYWQGGLPVA